MATVISLIAIDSGYRSIFHYLQCVFYALLFVYYVIFSVYFSNNDISYMKGRTIAWSFKIQQTYIFSAIVNLFFTRFVELLPKIPSIVFAVLNLIYAVIFLYLLFNYLPFIEFKDNTYHIACAISFFVGFILQVISKNFYEIDPALVVIIVIFLAVIMNLIINYLNEKRRNKSNDILNSLISEEITFEDAFKNKNEFLLTIRLAFIHGNSYVFTWQPFLNAIEAWPNDTDIWIQWIRFVIIYPDQGKRLEQIMYDVKNKGFKNFVMKYVIFQVKSIQKSRNKYMTPDLKQEFRDIDNLIGIIKTVIITYWNEISGGSLNSDSVYNISVKLKKMVDKVDSKYQLLLSLYPNNYSVSLKYSEFMDNIMSDPVVSQFWKTRTKILKNSKQVLTDATNEYGFDIFRFIPRNIQCIMRNDDSSSEQSKPKVLQYQTQISNSLLISNEEDVRNNNGAGDNNKLNDSFYGNESKNNQCSCNNSNEIENLDTTISHFRNLGLNAKVPFINILFAISIVFFIIAFIFVPFIPPFMMIGILNPYRKQFDSLKSVCNLRSSIIKEPYYMFFQALRSLNEMLADSFHPYNDSILNNEIIKLNKNAEYFQKTLGNVIKLESLSGKYINTTKILLVVRESATNTSFSEALSTMICHILHHDNPTGYYYDEHWFQFIFNNLDNIEHSIGTLSGLMCKDMNDYRDKSILIISIILYILIGIETIFIPIFIYFALRIRKNWNYIINTINSIPRVAIQKVIEKYSNEKSNKNVESHQNFKSEFRYKLSLTQMVSSRDTSGGLPIKSIIAFFFIDFIISIVCVISIIQIMNIVKKDLTNVPMQYYTGIDGIYAIYKFISVFLIKGLIDFRNAMPAMMKPPQPPIFTSSFGIFNHDYIRDGFAFIAKQMSDTLDNVIFGDSDNSERGILFSTQEILHLMTKSNGNPYGEGNTITNLDLEQFPYFAGLTLFYESNLKFIEQVLSDYYFNSVISMVQKTFDMATIFDSVKLGTYTLAPKFLDIYVQKTDELFNDSMDKTYLILFCLSSGLFVVGLLAIACLIVTINKVKKIVQFSLSLISMVDPIYVQEMQNVMNLFYGKTNGAILVNQALQRSFSKIESLVPECPIELNNQMIITSINEKLVEEWGIESEQVIGSHINLILTFNEKNVFDEIVKQTNVSHSKKSKHFDTIITINASKKSFHVSFTSYFVPKNKDVKLVLMFGDNFAERRNSVSIDEMKKENMKMKIQSIPNNIRDKFDLENGKNSFTSNYLIFCAIKITNFNEYLRNHSSLETKLFIKQFENQIIDICENDHNIDATYLKKIGNIFLICFNFIRQTTNFFKPAEESYYFIKKINSFAKSNNYQFKSAITSAKSATSFIFTQNILKFDVYSNEIQNILILLNNCRQNEIIFASRMKDFFQSNVTDSFEEIEISKINKESEWGYKINLTIL